MYASSSAAPSFNREALRPPECFSAWPHTLDCVSNRVSKREENSSETILIDSRSPSPEPRSNAESRQRLFTALELGQDMLREPRSITTADDLDEPELKRCFEILHACGTATDPDATLGSTKDTMEDFLDAVFKEWTGNATRELAKPIMDFVVREYISVGNICSQPTSHRSCASCVDSPACDTPVYGVASYRSRPAQLEISFSTTEPRRSVALAQEDLLCPMERPDVRWEDVDWMTELRMGLRRSCTVKIHRFNKHLAIWYARSLIKGWAEGSISMGKDGEVLAFLGREAVDAAFAIMGDGPGDD
ncbi:hypothetical protein F66182_7958 [Fusarium sp. NRRL 66182]|nr:hypothetical protein F66182_7958 [Fusarium sp. NRRL 66182]